MVCATYSAYTIYAGTMVNRPVAGAVAGVRLPAIWSADSTTTVGGKPVLTATDKWCKVCGKHLGVATLKKGFWSNRWE